MDAAEAVPTPVVEEPTSKRPPSNAFYQQKLRAWQPILTPRWVILSFLSVGVVFIAIGVPLYLASAGVVEYKVQYAGAKRATCQEPYCTYYDTVPTNTDPSYAFKSALTIKKMDEMKGPVFVYYELTNFYQNHRRYVKSRSDAQLRGEEPTTTASCEPLRSVERNGSSYTPNPCGLIANSMFNDTISFVADATFSATGKTWEDNLPTNAPPTNLPVVFAGVPNDPAETITFSMTTKNEIPVDDEFTVTFNKGVFNAYRPKGSSPAVEVACEAFKNDDIVAYPSGSITNWKISCPSSICKKLTFKFPTSVPAPVAPALTTLTFKCTGNLAPRVTMRETDIAWHSDKEKKFVNADGASSAPSGWAPKEASGVTATDTLYLKNMYPMLEMDAAHGGEGVKNEHFIVWMRTAALPNFRKLYGRIDAGIEKGINLDFTVVSRFPVDSFKGTKTIVLSTTSWLGGKNPFLGYAYFGVGGLCIVLAILFFIKNVFCPRKLGDPTHMQFDRQKKCGCC